MSLHSSLLCNFLCVFQITRVLMINCRQWNCLFFLKWIFPSMQKQLKWVSVRYVLALCRFPIEVSGLLSGSGDVSRTLSSKACRGFLGSYHQCCPVIWWFLGSWLHGDLGKQTVDHKRPEVSDRWPGAWISPSQMAPGNLNNLGDELDIRAASHAGWVMEQPECPPVQGLLWPGVRIVLTSVSFTFIIISWQSSPWHEKSWPLFMELVGQLRYIGVLMLSAGEHHVGKIQLRTRVNVRQMVEELGYGTRTSKSKF